ncbi:MAG: Rieske (2Fe-2S) protein [Armatimonadetes bacterium]|nr:Rieske (2Fe-2S) protein [Armatimonadota bacterium]
MDETPHVAHGHEAGLQEYELTKEMMTRRRLLSYLTGLMAGGIGLLLGVPLVGLAIGPLLTKKISPWVRLGGVSDVKPSEPTKFSYSYLKLDGWQQKTVRGTAYIVAKDGGNLTVFSNVCTHLGCGVRWDNARQAFLCPCHNGGFDINGKVILGPPPRPLDQFEHKIQGGVVFIKMKEG